MKILEDKIFLLKKLKFKKKAKCNNLNNNSNKFCNNKFNLLLQIILTLTQISMKINRKHNKIIKFKNNIVIM